PAGGEVVGQRPGAVARPGAEGGDELVLVDQAVLQGKQAEEQVALSSDGSHGASLPEGRRERCIAWSAPDVGSQRPGRAGSDGLSHEGSAQAAPPRPIRSNLPRVRRPSGSACGRVRLLGRKRTREGTGSEAR